MSNDLNENLVQACMLHRLRKASLEWPQTQGPGSKTSQIIKRRNIQSINQQSTSYGQSSVDSVLSNFGNLGLKSNSYEHVSRLVISMCDEFEATYNRVFVDMCANLHLNSTNGRNVFRGVIDELLGAPGGLKWGRIIALISFASCLAVRLVERGQDEFVDNILDWTVEYLESEPLSNWITDNGGWDGFAEFAECAGACSGDWGWPSIKTICSCAVGALGVLTLGAIFAQKS